MIRSSPLFEGQIQVFFYNWSQHLLSYADIIIEADKKLRWNMFE